MSNSSPNQLRPTEYRSSEDENERSGETNRTSQSAPGQLIAERYRLVRKLGAGGMGVVWVAHSLALGVDVAIKLIRSDRADSDLASRMAREAQATATLGHPAIVRVFDHGMTGYGDPFLVMELVNGETLSSLIDREGKLPATEAVRLLLPLCDGLRCAHERGIIHRDIKPENVLLARDPLGRVQPKLLDFGIAKLEHQPSVSRLTQLGDVLGSPEFMSPEQARGAADTDARTDVWALCVMLYEMVTGTVPFKNKNYNALMQSILHEPPVSILDYGVADKDLWYVIAKGLEKGREKRWAGMTQLGEALAFWLYDHGVTEDVCGNSLRAVWLGATLSGVSSRARVDSLPDGSLPPPGLESRGVPTLRLNLRRLRHRALRLVTPALDFASPKVLAVVAASFTVVVLLVALLSRGDEPSAPTPVPIEASPAPATLPAAPPLATSSSGPAEITPVPIDSLPHASASAKPRKAAPRYQAAPPKKKHVRDYGL